MSVNLLTPQEFNSQIFEIKDELENLTNVNKKIEKAINQAYKHNKPGQTSFKINKEKCRELMHKLLKDSTSELDCSPIEHRKIAKIVENIKSEVATELEELSSNSYRMYLLSAKSTIGFKVLGNETLRDDKLALSNFGRLQSPRSSPRSSPVFNEDEQNIGGAILSDTTWNVLKNDSVILGAIHACQNVYIPHDKETLCSLPDNELYKSSHMRILTREIVQLSESGYEIIEHKNGKSLGTVLVCKNFEKAKNSTLANLWFSVKELNSAATVREHLSKIPTTPEEAHVEVC